MYFIVRHIVRCDSVRLDQGERARDEDDDVGGGINSEEELCYCAKTRGHRELWDTHLAQEMDVGQPAAIFPQFPCRPACWPQDLDCNQIFCYIQVK